MRSSIRSLALLSTAICCLPVAAQGESPLDEEGRLVRFERDIVPILQNHCLKCHGPEKQEADFRVDDPDIMSSYVEPGDLEASSMFVDYLVTDDSDMRMPPPSEDPLSVQQIALLRVWIEEGADWPEGAEVNPVQQGETAAAAPAQPVPPRSFRSRFWAFQGFLHPATIHFPIALLVMGGMFVVLGWKWPPLGAQIPVACLVIGAASSVAASLMGWSFAEQRGHGTWFDPTKEIFWHRWSGVLVTVLAVVFAGVALAASKRDSSFLHKTWKSGLVIVAVLVGLVGHQGGELTYGNTFYQRAFDMLRGARTAVQQEVAEEVSKAADEAAELVERP